MIIRLNLIAAALVGAATALAATAADAQVSGDVVRVGVINDMSGLYSDLGGEGSVAAAKLAVEDFGPIVLGKKIEIVSADHQNKPGALVASGASP